MAQTEINISISDKAPSVYFKELVEQCQGVEKKYGGITEMAELKANLAENCIPGAMLSGSVPDYDSFLEERRKLMAAKLQAYFKAL